MWDFLSKISQNQPLALVVVGVILILIAAFGGVPPAGIQVQGAVWQAVLAAVGLVISFFGIWSVFGRSEHAATTGPRFDPEKWACKITSPRNGEFMPDEKTDVRGTCSPLPSPYELRIFDKDTGTNYYRHGIQATISSDGQWEAQNVDVSARPGEPRAIVAAVVGPCGQAFCNYYGQVEAFFDRSSRLPPGIPVDVPGITRRDVVTVKTQPGPKPPRNPPRTPLQ